MFNLLAAVSLVMFLLALALWVRSYWTMDLTGWQAGSNWCTLGDGGGRLVLDMTPARSRGSGKPTAIWNAPGLQFSRFGGAGWHLTASFAYLSAPLIVLPAAWM